MVTCRSTTLVVLCLTALVGTFFVLERAPAHGALRGERRLNGVETTSTASDLANGAANAASGAASAVHGHFKENGEHYKDKANEAAGAAWHHASNAAGAVGDHWNEHGEHYKDKANEAAGAAWHHTKNAASAVHGAVSDHWDEHGEHYKAKAKEWGSAAWHHTGKAAGYVGEHAGRLGNHVWENRDHYQDRLRNHVNEHGWWSYQPQDYFLSWLPKPLRIAIPVSQLIFAWLYWCFVVQNYGYWMGPTPMSSQLQALQAPMATAHTSPTNCMLSWLCPQARAAHTFDKTGTLDYWLSLVAMFCCPCLTLCLTNACTDLNPKLGGLEQNPVSSCLCTWCCSCCTIAQDAESLDAATGQQTGCCGVQGGMPPYGMGYPGMGMQGGPMQGPGMLPPGMQGMYSGGPGMYSAAPMYPGAGPGMFPPQGRMPFY